MKKLIFVVLLIMFSAFISCEGGGGSTEKVNGAIVESEKVYTINPIELAEFYYFTTSKVLYAYNAGYIKTIHLTASVAQDGHDDITEIITPVDFYKLGDYLNFELMINGETRYFEQLNGVMFEVESLWRRPDTIRQTMNNGRFSIETSTWTTYTVSDIRNLTTSSGIYRTIMCPNYYIGKYETYYDYGLYFYTIDDIGNYRSGLYFLSEQGCNIIKVVDEAGEMWKF